LRRLIRPISVLFFPLGSSLSRVCHASLLRVVGRTQLDKRTHPGGLLWKSDQLVTETATYTTRNKHKRRTFTLSAGLEPAVSAI